MVRELRCADLMPGCDFVAHGKDDSEVMKKTAEHAKSVHKMIAIAMEVEKKARASIRDAAGAAVALQFFRVTRVCPGPASCRSPGCTRCRIAARHP